MRDACESYHDHVASIYDDMYAKNPYWDFYHEVSWNHLQTCLPRDLSVKVHDVGCGTGLYGLRLLKAGFRVLFSDLSQKMLDAARRKVEAAGYADRAEFAKFDMSERTDIPDGSFGFVVGQGDPLSLCPNARRALQEIARTLAPGGAAVLSVDNRTSGYDHYLEKGDLEGLLGFHKSGVLTWPAERKDERYPYRTFDADDLAKLARDAGLTLESVIGKTVLPLRKHPDLLKDRKSFNALLKVEKKLAARPANQGCAPHLQAVFRKAPGA